MPERDRGTLLPGLLTEQENPASHRLDLLSGAALLGLMNASDREAVAAVEKALPAIAAAVEAIADAIRRGGHLVYTGAGTSGRLGLLDAAECPPTFGVSPQTVQAIMAGGPRAAVQAVEAVEDSAEAGAHDLDASGFSPADVLVGISASGRTPYVLGAVARAREIGAVTCGVSCSPGSELGAAVDYPIEAVTGPEILSGSTRLKAGTATKMVLNMISTAVMVRLGHVYGNLMVNVQPANRKLADRARRIVERAAGVDATRATELLEASGDDVRVAVIMGKQGLTRGAAEGSLARAGGNLRVALGESSGQS